MKFLVLVSVLVVVACSPAVIVEEPVVEAPLSDEEILQGLWGFGHDFSKYETIALKTIDDGPWEGAAWGEFRMGEGNSFVVAQKGSCTSAHCDVDRCISVIDDMDLLDDAREHSCSEIHDEGGHASCVTKEFEYVEGERTVIVLMWDAPQVTSENDLAENHVCYPSGIVLETEETPEAERWKDSDVDWEEYYEEQLHEELGCEEGYVVSYPPVPYGAPQPNPYCKIDKEWEEFDLCDAQEDCEEGLTCMSPSYPEMAYRCVPTEHYRTTCWYYPDGSAVCQ